MAQIVAIFQALLPILLRAVPTFLIFIALHWYLKLVLLQPLERVLEERRRRTTGAVEASQAAVAQAAVKMAEYERSLYEARAAIYAEQEANRRQLVADQADALLQAKAEAAKLVAAACAGIRAEAESARTELDAQSNLLAGRLADVVLAGRN
jgi:F-type H+-transporting ATPase subunit b